MNKNINPNSKIKILFILNIIEIVVIIALCFFICILFSTTQYNINANNTNQSDILKLENDLRKRGIIDGQVDNNAKPYSIEQMDNFKKYIEENPGAY